MEKEKNVSSLPYFNSRAYNFQQKMKLIERNLFKHIFKSISNK